MKSKYEAEVKAHAVTKAALASSQSAHGTTTSAHKSATIKLAECAAKYQKALVAH